MQVDFAFLCDAATESGGKLFALGIGVDRLHVPQLPARHGRFTVAARLTFATHEGGRHAFAIRFVDADGRSILPEVIGDMEVTMPANATLAKTNMLVDLVNAELYTYGPHEVTIRIDGDDVVTLPLEVVPAA